MAATRGSRGQTEWAKCSAQKLLQSESLSCLYDRPHEKLKWDHNNTMGVPGHFIAAGQFRIKLISSNFSGTLVVIYRFVIQKE